MQGFRDSSVENKSRTDDEITGAFFESQARRNLSPIPGRVVIPQLPSQHAYQTRYANPQQSQSQQLSSTQAASQRPGGNASAQILWNSSELTLPRQPYLQQHALSIHRGVTPRPYQQQDYHSQHIGSAPPQLSQLQHPQFLPTQIISEQHQHRNTPSESQYDLSGPHFTQQRDEPQQTLGPMPAQDRQVAQPTQAARPLPFYQPSRVSVSASPTVDGFRRLDQSLNSPSPFQHLQEPQSVVLGVLIGIQPLKRSLRSMWLFRMPKADFTSNWEPL